MVFIVVVVEVVVVGSGGGEDCSIMVRRWVLSWGLCYVCRLHSKARFDSVHISLSPFRVLRITLEMFLIPNWLDTAL